MKKFLLALLACLTCNGCPPTPIPVPPPGPQPPVVSDAAPAVDAYPTNPAFTGKVFDCTLPIVQSQRARTIGAVDECLKTPPVNCLAKLVDASDINTVACLARDLGASSQVAVRAGSTDPFDAVRAKNAREWILAERLGYR